MKNTTIYKNEQGKKKLLAYYETYLETFNVEFERVYADTRYGKTHVLVTGPKEGKPVFIFQGGNCINPVTLSWFSGLLTEYRVYAPDTIGHPGYSDETRVSAKDESFALWTADLMEFFNVGKSAFVGPSYGAGIILRLAAFLPEKISCAALISPAGIKLGPKQKVMREIMLPLMLYHTTSSPAYLDELADVLSYGSMSETDKQIIGEVFKTVRLDQEMPKLVKRRELMEFESPTLVIAGEEDVFFPAEEVIEAASFIIPNLVKCHSYPIGHFPSAEYKAVIGQDVKEFLSRCYRAERPTQEE